ncbi:hypothetical protein GGR57DRAFT_180448 [Xylariaceae sp. FL1272]|nr:hypothetical protein GGR57DRAFT_180448 [Xylariaceae sp. FL1272]
MTESDTVPAKSKRVRTGCLTCRERHLKCDEGSPECKNCRKSNRECKRGIRLNFLETLCPNQSHIELADDWRVEFHDESRLIASEYRGGLSSYAKFDPPMATPPQEPYVEARPATKSRAVEIHDKHTSMEPRSAALSRPASQAIVYDEQAQTHPDLRLDAQIHSRKSSGTTFAPPTSNSAGATNFTSDGYMAIKDEETNYCHQSYMSSNDSSAHSAAGETGVGPPSTTRISPNLHDPSRGPDSGPITPPNDKSGEREYLNSPEELELMQVFINEVGLWMDSLDKEKHFSRVIPFHALKCPMLLNALLACGARHLSLTEQYSDEKALFYYDTATTQLLRSLQNPERNTAECATTAVILNVYEVMSEKPTKRMSHIAGARALIRECQWNAKTPGLGAACFWLNVGMELLSCLAFNWATSWEPEGWGVNMDFNTERVTGNEEIWVHRIFFIVAKIANFRASVPKFQEASPHDEQLRVQYRMGQWELLKGMCKDWDSSCPRSMHPFGYVYPSQHSRARKSLFPNIWLVKRAAVVGRLYYHMALCILAQANPSAPKDSQDARITQQHHAHQVCGIVAHNKDRGIASVCIRSTAIVAEVLTDLAEQEEVISIIERIDSETAWRLGAVVKALKKTWGWEKDRTPSLASSVAAGIGMPTSILGNLSSEQSSRTPPQMAMSMAHTPTTAMPQQMQPVAPRPTRVNPLGFADFKLPNHPYQNWYKPPSRSNTYSSQGLS